MNRVAGFSIFAVGLVCYTALAIYLAPISLKTNNAIFGADTVEIAEAMTHLTFEGDMHRHPLFSLITAPLVHGLAWLPLIDEHRAILLTIGIIAAGNLALAWWVLSRLVPQVLAISLTVMYGMFFSNLVLWSIPETYALAGVMIAAFMMVLFWRLTRPTFYADVLLGVVIGLAGLVNPPLLSLLVIVMVYEWRVGRQCFGDGLVALWSIAAIGSVALLLFATGYTLTVGEAGVLHTAGTAQKWGAFGNLIDLKQWLFVGLTFFVGAVVSPVSIRPELFLGDYLDYIGSPLSWASLIAFFSIAVCGFYQVAKAQDPWLWPILSWMAIMLTFYVYFNPHEAMLYSSQCLFPLLVVIARGLNLLRLSGDQLKPEFLRKQYEE